MVIRKDVLMTMFKHINTIKKDDFKTLIAFFHRLTLFVPILLFISEYLKHRNKRGKIDSKRVSN